MAAGLKFLQVMAVVVRGFGAHDTVIASGLVAASFLSAVIVMAVV